MEPNTWSLDHGGGARCGCRYLVIQESECDVVKFTDGNWMLREGVQISSPSQAHSVEVTEHTMTVYAPTKPLRHRGDTLNEPLLSLEFSSPREDVIRVRFAHHLGGVPKGPQFRLQETRPEVSIENTLEEAIFRSGETKVVVRKDEYWEIRYYYQDRLLTKSGARNLGYIQVANDGAYVREQLHLGVGELLYGLGERFTSFIKNGQEVEIWNRDGGTGSDQAYKNVPFYLSNQGYGVLVNHPEKVSFEIGTERVSKAQFSVAGEILDYCIVGGRDMKDALQNFVALTGRPALPPAWSFGLWLTTSFTTSYDEETVNSFIDGMEERGIPLQVFHFDCFWMKEFQWCDFAWDNRVFPDPEGMLRRLKEKGLQICVWINPYIAQRSPLFAEGAAKGYFLQRPNGDVWQWDMWQAGMAVVDFTNPQACAWYASHLQRLLAMGVDTFKTDFGERIPTDVVYHDGSDPEKMHNYYSYLYNKVVFECIEQYKGKHDAVVFARSGTTGSQQFPVHWGGDCAANYESMAESLRGGLSLSLSGFGFWSHDIGGFEHTATADVYKRWTAFGLLSSHARLHGSGSYRVPWLFDEEAVEVMRYFTKLRCRLMPYLFQAAVAAHRAGIPVMRPMVLEFPEDPTCHHLDRQYMLGDSLLVAPVFSEDGMVQYYLPEGTWTHLLTNTRVEGGRWFHEYHGYSSLPLFVRDSSALPMGLVDNQASYAFADSVELHLFALADGAAVDVTVPNQDGTESLVVRVERQGNTVTARASKATAPWSFMLRGETAAAIDGVRQEASGLGCHVRPDNASGEIIVTLADSRAE